ncbi:MAG: CBS domain-containing protein [Hydrogenophaga sp.]|nr:CBS domain-containing protein [Hydrogenophaga sp.]
MQVGSVCSREIVTVDAQSSVAEAASLMREHHVGAVVVTQQAASSVHVCGIVTDRDLVIRVLTDPNANRLDPVSQCAQGSLAVLLEDDGLEEAVEAMKQRGVRRLLVKDANDRLTGVLSLDDLIKVFSVQLAGLSNAIQVGLTQERRSAEAAEVATASPEMRFPCFGTGTWSPAVNRNERS